MGKIRKMLKIKTLIIICFFIFSSSLSFAYEFEIQGYVYDQLTHQPIKKHLISIHDQEGLFEEVNLYTNETGFYSCTFELAEFENPLFVVQTFGFCENFWLPYITEIEAINGTVEVSFNICHNPVGLEQIFRITGYIRDETTLEPFKNMEVIITENYNSNQQRKLITDENGLYSTVFVLPPLYTVDFVIDVKGNCNNVWVNYSDTTQNFEGSYFKNFNICHDTLWYFGLFCISGYVRDETTFLPVSNHPIFFIQNVNNQQISKVQTDENGYYSKSFQINLLEENIFFIKTYSYCNNEWKIYNDTVTGTDGNYIKNFYTCSYNPAEVECKISFDYFVENNTNKVSFYEISLDTIIDRYWTLGDGFFNSNPYFTHNYQTSGIYNVCINITTNNNCTNSLCKNISVGNLFSLKGYVYAGNNLLPKGKALLYKYLNNEYFLIDSSEIGEGEYYFDTIFDASYSVYAIPFFDYDEIYFPKYFPTYNSSDLNWSDAESFYLNGNIENRNIYLLKYENVYYGKCSISGEITYNLTNSNELNNFEINVLLYNEENEVIAFSGLNDENKFKFENIPFGKYKIYPENAERTTNPLEITVNQDFQNYENANFIVYDEYIDVKVSIEEISKQNADFKIYPNPFSSKITIFTNAFSFESNLEIIDITGKTVYTSFINSDFYEVNLDFLKSGIYLIKVTNHDEIVHYEKIIKF